MQQKGYNVKEIVLSGGLVKNSLFVKFHTDVTGVPVVVSHGEHGVVLGSAMLGHTAYLVSNEKLPIEEAIDMAMNRMAGKGEVTHPDRDLQRFHQVKYEIYRSLQAQSIGVRH